MFCVTKMVTLLHIQCTCMSLKKICSTVEPGYNEPLHNEDHGIINNNYSSAQ